MRSKIVYVQNLLPNALHSGFAEPGTHEETNTGRKHGSTQMLKPDLPLH